MFLMLFKRVLWVSIILFSHAVYAEAKTLKVALDWFVNPNHAPLLIAQQKGYFTQENLSVEFLTPADPADPPKWVATQKADIGVSYQPQLLQQIQAGMPLVRIGALIHQPLNCVTVLESSDIKELKDLRHKSIGYSGNTDLPILKTLLKMHHLKLKDVNLINVHYNLTQALLTKKVDATIGMTRNFEPIQINLFGYKTRNFYPEQLGIPSYEELIFIVNKRDSNAKFIKGFLRAVTRAMQDLRAHPEQEWQRISKHYPELNNTLNKTAWFETVKYFPERTDVLPEKRYQEFALFMQHEGIITTVPDLKTYTHNSH